MRRRLIAVALIAAALLLVTSCGGDDAPAPSAVSGLETRNVEAGQVEVEVEPRQLDGQGAVFAVTMDTHSVELDADLTETATLEVGGAPWPVQEWTGDGPGGHHREGELSFEPGGPPQGAVRLMLEGFSEPVEVEWPRDG